MTQSEKTEIGDISCRKSQKATKLHQFTSTLTVGK